MTKSMNKTTLRDFDEAWRYGANLTTVDRKRFEKLVKNVIHLYGEQSEVAKILMEAKDML